MEYVPTQMLCKFNWDQTISRFLAEKRLNKWTKWGRILIGIFNKFYCYYQQIATTFHHNLVICQQECITHLNWYNLVRIHFVIKTHSMKTTNKQTQMSFSMYLKSVRIFNANVWLALPFTIIVIWMQFFSITLSVYSAIGSIFWLFKKE